MPMCVTVMDLAPLDSFTYCIRTGGKESTLPACYLGPKFKIL